MMSKEFLKRIGVLGVSFGLLASPLAFGDFPKEAEEANPAQEELITKGHVDVGPGIVYGNDEEDWEEGEEE